MGIHITLGFEGNARRGEPTLLYLGQDSGAAAGVFLNPPAGFLRTELLSHVSCTRQRSHDGSGVGFVGISPRTEVIPVTLEDLPEEMRKEIEESLKAQGELEKVVADLEAANRGIKERDERIASLDAGRAEWLLQRDGMVEALNERDKEHGVLKERITALEAENAKLLEEIQLLRDAAATACAGTAQPQEEAAAAKDAPGEAEKAEGDTLKLGLPPKGAKAKDK